MNVQINSERLWRRHMELAEFGATPDGGVHRLALSGEDISAHRMLADISLSLGFTLHLDAIGNLFIRREGMDPSLAPIVSGSHCDTQPNGGRFDGILGVLAAFEVLQSIDDAGVTHRHPIQCVIWNNEEGARFVPGCMGSAVYAGAMPLARALVTKDGDGTSMEECVQALAAAIPEAAVRQLGAPFSGYLEVHIEQGPELERKKNAIGVVSGIQGHRRLSVDIVGRTDHSGTMPCSQRRDAMMSALRIIEELRKALWDEKDILRFTVSKFALFPNAWAVVPGRVTFGVDLRHPLASELERCGDLLIRIANEYAAPCEVTIEEIAHVLPTSFEGAAQDAILAATQEIGLPYQIMMSGAAHDARNAARLCPAGMIFVPCKGGVSHNPAEYSSPEDIAAGTQVLANAILRLAI